MTAKIACATSAKEETALNKETSKSANEVTSETEVVEGTSARTGYCSGSGRAGSFERERGICSISGNGMQAKSVKRKNLHFGY